MSAPAVPLVIQIINQWKAENQGKTPKVISMGYPDILMDIKEIGLEGLEPHPESESIQKYHGKSGIVIPSTESFFKVLGCEFTCLDIKQWRGNEFIGDLNDEIVYLKGFDKDENEIYKTSVELHFDILLDLGTTEHCFNVGQVMSNYVNLLEVGGYAIHWNPHYMPNHGFYNFSPTFFMDFYGANGYELYAPLVFEKQFEPKGVMVEPYGRYNLPSVNSSMFNVAKKLENVKEITWPTQTKYKNLDKMNKD